MRLSGHLEQILSPGSRLSFGELVLLRDSEGVFEARHARDLEAAGSLREIPSVREMRELAKYDASGEYRPLRTAPGLRGGWRTATASPDEFLRRLDAVYPALFATWIALRRGAAAPVPLRRTLNRQTGMYRFAGGISGAMAGRIRRELCAAGCLRQIAWPDEEDDETPRLEAPERAIPLLCAEACTFAVNLARELAKEARGQGGAPPPPVPEG
jgi:sirohydrochlorin cobaltochelatase